MTAKKGLSQASMQAPLITGTARLWLGKDGVARLEYLPASKETLESVKENVVALRRLCGGRRVPLFNDIRQVKAITREARLYLEGQEPAEVVCAVALLVGTPLSNMLGSFYLRVHKTRVPHKLFTAESKALQWLKGFIQ